MAQCARCTNEATTRVRYQHARIATDVCEAHHAQFQQSAAAAGVRLVYDDGVAGGIETAAEMLAALRKLNARLDSLEKGAAPTEPAARKVLTTSGE